MSPEELDMETQAAIREVSRGLNMDPAQLELTIQQIRSLRQAMMTPRASLISNPFSRSGNTNWNDEDEDETVARPVTIAPQPRFTLAQSSRLSDRDILDIVRGTALISHVLTHHSIQANYDDINFLWSVMKGDPHDQIINPTGAFHPLASTYL
jgi:hypothetical protein